MSVVETKEGWIVIDEEGFQVTREIFVTKQEAMEWMDWAEAGDDDCPWPGITQGSEYDV